MRRSQHDLDHGDAIRAKVLMLCPHCGCSTSWRTVSEYSDHLRSCAVIALGQAVGTIELPPLDDMLPEVEKKPRGWSWGDRSR